MSERKNDNGNGEKKTNDEVTHESQVKDEEKEADEPRPGTSHSTVHSPVDSDIVDLPSVVISVSDTSSSSICRICQLSDTEIDELIPCKCRCKGYLAKSHRQCLMEWVRHKGSNTCEICGGVFEDIPPPPPRPRHHQYEGDHRTVQAGHSPAPPDYIDFELTAIQWQLERFPPLSRKKRSAVASVILFLVLITAVSAVMTVSADREFKAVAKDPYVTKAEMDKAHIMFSICVSFVFFCGTLTLGLILLWIVVEGIYSLQRRRVMEQAARNFLEGRRVRQQARARVV